MPAIMIILCVLLCMPFHILAAGAERFQFSHITATDGLPHQQINGLAQDNEGYIWMSGKYFLTAKVEYGSLPSRDYAAICRKLMILNFMALMPISPL